MQVEDIAKFIVENSSYIEELDRLHDDLDDIITVLYKQFGRPPVEIQDEFDFQIEIYLNFLHLERMGRVKRSLCPIKKVFEWTLVEKNLTAP